MAHAIISFVQRRTPKAGRSCVFQEYGSLLQAILVEKTSSLCETE